MDIYPPLPPPYLDLGLAFLDIDVLIAPTLVDMSWGSYAWMYCPTIKRHTYALLAAHVMSSFPFVPFISCGLFFFLLQSVLRSIQASDPVRFDRLKPWVRIIDAEIATVRPHSGVTPEQEARALAQ